jgi:NADPH-dependent 2,4-dienoyl-CoA reductase/sulfur reductase-like enzyme
LRAELITVWLERDDLLAETTPPSYPPLEGDITTDVLVVGGGIAGLHIAYEILQTGLKKVVLIDDGSEYEIEPRADGRNRFG